MDGIPNDTAEIATFLIEEVLHGVELDPDESRALVRYLRDRHDRFYGPFTTYFVLGSYERPFKFRLEAVADELNSRVDAYAYLQATQRDLDVSADLPELKVKFYVHALYADYIATVLEHNTGGALVEFGRLDRGTLFNRTFVFPRGLEPRYDAWNDRESVRARALEVAFEADDESDLEDRIGELAKAAREDGIDVTADDLWGHLEHAFDEHLPPTYTGLVPDGATHYEQAGRCFPWTTEDELLAAVNQIPHR